MGMNGANSPIEERTLIMSVGMCFASNHWRSAVMSRRAETRGGHTTDTKFLLPRSAAVIGTLQEGVASFVRNSAEYMILRHSWREYAAPGTMSERLPTSPPLVTSSSEIRHSPIL